MGTGSRTRILLVEDNPGDVWLTREALCEDDWEHALDVVTDGAKAISYLRREQGYEKSRRPDLILLDLNLPLKDGREVLQEVKGDPSLRLIPVVVLTSSTEPRDVTSAYDHHANCYVQKPVGLQGFAKTVSSIKSFWLSTAVLPPEGHAEHG